MMLGIEKFMLLKYVDYDKLIITKGSRDFKVFYCSFYFIKERWVINAKILY